MFYARPWIYTIFLQQLICILFIEFCVVEYFHKCPVLFKTLFLRVGRLNVNCRPVLSVWWPVILNIGKVGCGVWKGGGGKGGWWERDALYENMQLYYLVCPLDELTSNSIIYSFPSVQCVVLCHCFGNWRQLWRWTALCYAINGLSNKYISRCKSWYHLMSCSE